MKRAGRVAAALTVLAFALGLMPASASAGERKTLPDDDPGPPAYVTGVNDDQWAAITFVRNPDCVPENANLLAFDPAVFECPLTIEGFAVYEQAGDVAPTHAVMREAGPLETWFLSTADLALAISDGILTTAELASADSLIVGSAMEYHVTIHPEPAADNVVVVVTARGTLNDGRTFQVHATLRDFESSRFPVQLCGCHEGPVEIRFR